MSATDGNDEIFDRGDMLERLGGDDAMLAEVILFFRAESPGMLQRVREATEQADPASVERAAHTIKGALLNLSARQAAGVAGELESAGREKRLDGCAGILRRLSAELDALDAALDAAVAD